MRTPPDDLSASIRFGIELETSIPVNCGIDVGGYHQGLPVITGLSKSTQTRIPAPTFLGSNWRADNDGSIRNEEGFKSAEFVSPILVSVEGVDKLLAFVVFAKEIGGTVGPSCGCHITVSIPSVTGCASLDQITGFIRRLSRLAHKHALAIYAQTGTSRHENIYSMPLPKTTGEITNTLRKEAREMPGHVRANELVKLGRGLVNFRKALPNDLAKSAVEFRAFAGTLNEHKILHHLATVLGLCRRAATMRNVPAFERPDEKPPRNGVEALQRLWKFLGWEEDDAGPDVCYGQFGALYTRFPQHRVNAMKMAQKFDEKYPDAAHKLRALQPAAAH